MSDARALLKAKRQEARVNHPLAVYSTSGQLRCVACGSNVKHASSWEGHVGSKAHRVKTARLREQEQKEAEQPAEIGKRKALADVSTIAAESDLTTKKRKLSPEDVQVSPLTVASQPPATTSFPTNFFSDPSKVPPPSGSDDEDEGAESGVASTRAQFGTASTAIDAEWETFQATVLNPPDDRDKYESATIYAEPTVANEVSEGFPPLSGEGIQTEAETTHVNTEELRRRKEHEDRELIMDRLMEEERVQEEADAKVSLLKQRLENLRKQRQAARAAKSKKKS